MMDGYSSPYVSIIPRLLPSQFSSKKIPMSDDGYQYIDNRPISSHLNPSTIQNNSQSLAMRNDLNNQDNIPYTNQSVNSNYINNPFKARNSINRLHLEALKDNSGEQAPSNLNSGYGYLPNQDNKSYDNFHQSPSQQNSNQNYPKTLIIMFGILIGLFSITALAISIYLLVRLSTTTTLG